MPGRFKTFWADCLSILYCLFSARPLDDKPKNIDSKAGDKGSKRSFGLVNNGRDLRSIMEENGISPANQLHLLEALVL